MSSLKLTFSTEACASECQGSCGIWTSVWHEIKLLRNDTTTSQPLDKVFKPGFTNLLRIINKRQNCRMIRNNIILILSIDQSKNLKRKMHILAHWKCCQSFLGPPIYVGTMSFHFRNIFQWESFHRHRQRHRHRSPVDFLKFD